MALASNSRMHWYILIIVERKSLDSLKICSLRYGRLISVCRRINLAMYSRLSIAAERCLLSFVSSGRIVQTRAQGVLAWTGSMLTIDATKSLATRTTLVIRSNCSRTSVEWSLSFSLHFLSSIVANRLSMNLDIYSYLSAAADVNTTVLLRRLTRSSINSLSYCPRRFKA